LKILKQNPYSMLAFLNWKSTDAAALTLGISKSDSKRLVGAVESCIYERLDEGHTSTSVEILRNLLTRKICAGDIEPAIMHAVTEGAIRGNSNSGYQPIGAAAMEENVARQIRRTIGICHSLYEKINETRNNQSRFELAIKRIEAELGFQLNNEQIDAVLMASVQKISIITGGAGVGKTTVLKGITFIANLLGQTVFQMALAGRAAKNMANSSNYEAMTIAKFLHRFKPNKFKIPDQSLVIIDEASMLDLPTTFRILNTLPHGTRILLIGDPAQLPPIGFGLIFPKVIESTEIPLVRLETVHRQAQATGIPQVANAVREHLIPQIPSYSGTGNGVSCIDCKANEITRYLDNVVSDAAPNEWQIVSAVNDGISGVHQINKFFNEKHMGIRLPGFKFAKGEPVIFLRNDYERDLMNGTIGIIIDVVNSGETGLKIEFEREVHFIPSEELEASIDLAYAISVHKAQGSQFNRVAIVVTKSRNMDHSLIYTALTRGISQVVFIGDIEAMKSAILNASMASRRDVCFQI